MLSEIYQRPFQHKRGDEAARERLALCTEKGIALSDTVYQCRRKVAESSKDSDLEIFAKMDILKILRKHPSINTIILTGGSGPVSAHHLFYELLHERKLPHKQGGTKIPIHGSFKLKDRIIEVHTLYSTSGLNIGRYAEAVKQYSAVLPA